MITKHERRGNPMPGGIISKPLPATGLAGAGLRRRKLPPDPRWCRDKMSREKIFHLWGWARHALLTRPTSIKATRPITVIMPAALLMKRRGFLHRPV